MNTENPDPSKLASYIVVRKRLPVGMKAVSACHAAVALHLRFHDRAEYADWLSYSFKKRIVEVSDEKFDAAKQIADHVVKPYERPAPEPTLINVMIGNVPLLQWLRKL